MNDVKVTSTILGYKDTNTNFLMWSEDLYLVLCINDLYEYISEKIINRVNVKDIKSDELKDYIKINGDSTKVYDKNVTELMLKSDEETKTIILNSISKKYKDKLDFEYSTAYEIYNKLKIYNGYTKSKRVPVILNELNKLEFDKEKLSVSLLLSYMNKLFKELEDFGIFKTDYEKFEYLYMALPEDLIMLTCIMYYRNDWEKCCEMLIDGCQYYRKHLKKVKEKE